jgi:hypothetical protein
MMNKILSLATDVNRTKLLLASPLLFLVLTIATTPAQAQYWNGYGIIRATSNDTIQDTYMDIAMDKTTTPTIAQGILAGTVVDTAKGIQMDKHNIRRHKQINRTNSNSSNNPNPPRLVALVVVRL